MKVLIIDDSPQALAVARARLAKEGLEICCADSGQAGIDVAKREKPDLILLDVDMPEMSGFEVCRILKIDPDLNAVPIIFLSASVGTRDKVRGLDLGAMDYVTKPFDAFELRARVRAALRSKHMRDLLVQYTQIDPLTELWNRRALTERLGQEWARIRRHGGCLAVVMMDLDDFKEINDAHGHTAGDRLLCEVAGVLRRRCRQSDLPARYGGDEFAVLLPNQNIRDAARFAERCRGEIASIRPPIQDAVVRTTGTFGVADSRGAGDVEEVIRRADEAMYEAKRAGRNRVAKAPEPAQAATE